MRSATPGNGSSDDLHRQTNQEDAVRKLMGSRGLSSPTRPMREQKSASSLAQSQPKPESISLAAFMGGRATGPRLNRHAPQQDAHDPTQFDQRTRSDAPHPVFGRGGIAMPGMTAKGRTSPMSETTTHNREVFERSRSTGPKHDHDEFLSSTRISTQLRSVENPPAAPSEPANRYGNRNRSTSISSGTPRAKSPYLQPKESSSNAESDTDGGSGLREPYAEKRKTSRSASPGTSLHSRGITPEPSTPTVQPDPQSTNRSYGLPSTHRGPSPGPIRLVEQQKSAPPPPTTKPDTVSLAAFIGGRATGPRLNRHAPQQDANDPTQFDQRSDITAPHPVFGKGGVAMPGMTAKEASSAKYRSSGQLRDNTDGSQSTPHRSEEQLSTSLNAGNGIGNRQRAISTPGEVTARSGYSPPQGDYLKPSSSHPPAVPDKQPKPPTTNANSPPTSPPVVSRPYTPRQSSASASPSSSSPQKASPIMTPSLARPIQPIPRQSPTGPQIPPTKNPSRAFLRPPAEKEPSPSLSRLKGRGFVQNMIKTSTQLEASANEFGGTPSSNNDRAAPRKSSVLDRWQPAASANPSPASPPISPKPIPIRKSRTMDQPSSYQDAALGSIPPKSSSKPDDGGRSLKTVASLPALPSADPPRPPSRASLSNPNGASVDMPLQDKPGLGSSSTLISYIKPTKTGDDPVPPATAASSDIRANLDRVGQGGKKSLTSELPVASGQPLKHVRFSGNN